MLTDARRQRALRSGVVVLSCVGAFACDPSRTSERVDGSVFSWVQCIDCMHGQFARVVALGDTAVPRLTEILISGPPVAHDSAYMESLRRIVTGQGTSALAVIDHQRRMFARTYRRRALEALEAIQSPPAIAALCLARLSTTPAELGRPAIDSSVARIGATCP